MFIIVIPNYLKDSLQLRKPVRTLVYVEHEAYLITIKKGQVTVSNVSQQKIATREVTCRWVNEQLAYLQGD
ncbi:MAG: hypothetical protein AAB875_07840, partial [Patescibacteria group bacterium]